MSKPRWMHDQLVIDNTVIGCVEEDAFGRGWWAYGCMEDWQDTPLGMQRTQAQARKRVKEWAEERL